MFFCAVVKQRALSDNGKLFIFFYRRYYYVIIATNIHTTYLAWSGFIVCYRHSDYFNCYALPFVFGSTWRDLGATAQYLITRYYSFYSFNNQQTLPHLHQIPNNDVCLSFNKAGNHIRFSQSSNKRENL